jgi:hypothetical protein
MRRRPVQDDSSPAGAWVAACTVMTVLGLITLLLQMPFLTGAAAVLAGLFGLALALGGHKLEDRLDRHLFIAGLVVMVVAGLNGAVGIEQFKREVQPPITRRIVAHWEAGGGLFVRVEGAVYEVFDRSAWPPTDGALACLTIRDPRLGRPSVEQLRQGACDD